MRCGFDRIVWNTALGEVFSSEFRIRDCAFRILSAFVARLKDKSDIGYRIPDMPDQDSARAYGF